MSDATTTKKRRGLFKTMKTLSEASTVDQKRLTVEEQGKSLAEMSKGVALDHDKSTIQNTTEKTSSQGSSSEEEVDDTNDFLGLNAAPIPPRVAPAPVVTTTTSNSGPPREDVVDVLGAVNRSLIRADRAKEEKKKNQPDGLSLLGAYADSSSSDDEGDPNTADASNASESAGEGAQKRGLELDPALEAALRKQKKQFKDFDPSLLMDVSSQSSEAWKLHSGMSGDTRARELNSSVYDSSTRNMMYTNQAGGLQKAKHQIGWLAADVFENEDDLRRRGEEARKHKKRAAARYGW